MECYMCAAEAVKQSQIAEPAVKQITAAANELPNPVVDVLKSLVQQVCSPFCLDEFCQCAACIVLWLDHSDAMCSRA